MPVSIRFQETLAALVVIQVTFLWENYGKHLKLIPLDSCTHQILMTSFMFSGCWTTAFCFKHPVIMTADPLAQAGIEAGRWPGCAGGRERHLSTWSDGCHWALQLGFSTGDPRRTLSHRSMGKEQKHWPTGP